MLTDAMRYMEVLKAIDELLESQREAIFSLRTPDNVVHDLRQRHRQLADVRSLITGEANTLPHS